MARVLQETQKPLSEQRLLNGGVGGNRTRVRKHATTSSTYLV